MSTMLRHFKILLAVLTTIASTASVLAQTPAATERSDTLTVLLDTLKDPEKRDALIAELETLDVAPAAAVDQEAPGFADRMADFTTTAGEDFANRTALLFEDIGRIRLLFTTSGRETVWSEAGALLITILATSIVFLGFYRLIKRRVMRAEPNRTDRLSLQIGSLIKHALVGAASLFVAYLIGYALAFLVLGSDGLSEPQALYLNAFLLVGIFGLAMRLVVSGDEDDLTLSNLPRAAQGTILHWVRLVFGTAVYGVLAAAPIAQVWTNFLVGRSVRAIVVLASVILALVAIRIIKRSIDRSLAAEAPLGANGQSSGHGIGVWTAIWPWFAVAYVVASFGIAISRPSDMAALIATATAYTAGAYAVLVAAMRVFGQIGTTSLPALPRMEAALPGFSKRIGSIVPILTGIFAVVLFIFAVGLLATGWTSFDVLSWIGSGQGGWSSRIVNSAVLALALIVLWALVASWIDNRLALDLPGRNVSARTRTLLSLFRNAFTIAIVIIGTMTVLSEIGINIAPLLAGAGVVGLAIGFGAQKLVQDIITGVFIQLENAINEGDVITVAGLTGGVEKLTIRSVSLRSLDGQFHIIPFSAVDTVSNFMRRFGYHVAEIGVGYSEDVPAVKEAMLEAFRRLEQTEHKASILEPFEMHGVTLLGDSSVTVRGRIKTRPGDQWALGRAYTEIIKQVLDERGIEIPFPHREIKFPREFLEKFAPSKTAG